MKVEYEATFTNIDKEKIRARLKMAGAILVKPEFLMKRVVFELPAGHEIPGGWLRVRDEGDKITMSLKIVDGDKIENQKEVQLVIDSFAEGVSLLETLGARRKAFQESRRELWRLDDVEITIDEWPYLEPYVEVEGDNEEIVKVVSEKIGFDYSNALFCSADTLYSQKYNLPTEVINNKIELITFNGPNPFIENK